MPTKKPIRYGVLGIGRGKSFMGEGAKVAGFELVAVCDLRSEAVNRLARERNITAYTDFDRFLEHDFDAVVLCNYFHEHAPFAIKAMNAGKHVMSECAACHTLGEGVELIRTVEKTGMAYMFAENYAYTPARQEMRRVFQSGALGPFMYGEGEYVHAMPSDVHNEISPGIRHWRNWFPATYYCTHALSPIMYITDCWPEKVNAFVVRKAMEDPRMRIRANISDAASMIALRMDNGAVAKLLQVNLRGHGGPTRIHCAKGAMNDQNRRINITREQYHEKIKHPKEISYVPNLPLGDLAAKSGHGGGDFWMMYYFGEAIRTGASPFLDVYRGVTMSIVGIQAWRSALNDSGTEVIPDFRKESVRRKYVKDDWSPDPNRCKPGNPPPSIEGFREIQPEALKYAKKIWKSAGYNKTIWQELGYSDSDIAKMT